MTQASQTIDGDQSGTLFTGDLNAALGAVLSTHSGATAPSYKVSGTLWVDTSGSPWVLKIYDGTDWISSLNIDIAADTVAVPGHIIGVNVQAYDADTVKKDVANAFTAQQTPLRADLTYNATQTWDCATHQVAELTTLSAAITSFSAPTNQVDGTTYVLIGDFTTYQVTAWNSVFKWGSATPPTLTGVCVLTFISDGTNMRSTGVLTGIA